MHAGSLSGYVGVTAMPMCMLDGFISAVFAMPMCILGGYVGVVVAAVMPSYMERRN